jgi:hypothetical protein
MSESKKQRAKKERPPPTPKEPKPWDIPPIPDDEGDAAPDITFAAVGRALTNWERFESQLSQLFVVMVGAKPWAALAAMRAYGSIQTFRGRAEMLTAAAETFFLVLKNPEMFKLVKDFIGNDCTQYASRRNEIAHGIVHNTDKWKSGKVGSALFPARYATKKYKVGIVELGPYGSQVATYVYRAKEIGYFADRFSELEGRADDLVMQAAYWRAGRERDIEASKARATKPP